MVFRGPRGLKTRKTIKIVVFHENTIKLVIFHEIDREVRFLPILKKFLISGPPRGAKIPMEFASYLYVSEQVPSGTPKNHQFHENPPIFTHFHGIPLNLVESHENGEKLVISTIFRSTAVPAVPAAPAVPAVPAVRHGPLGLMGALGLLGLQGLQGLLVVQRRSDAGCSTVALQ